MVGRLGLCVAAWMVDKLEFVVAGEWEYQLDCEWVERKVETMVYTSAEDWVCEWVAVKDASKAARKVCPPVDLKGLLWVGL